MARVYTDEDVDLYFNLLDTYIRRSLENPQTPYLRFLVTGIPRQKVGSAIEEVIEETIEKVTKEDTEEAFLVLKCLIGGSANPSAAAHYAYIRAMDLISKNSTYTSASEPLVSPFFSGTYGDIKSIFDVSNLEHLMVTEEVPLTVEGVYYEIMFDKLEMLIESDKNCKEIRVLKESRTRLFLRRNAPKKRNSSVILRNKSRKRLNPMMKNVVRK